MNTNSNAGFHTSTISVVHYVGSAQGYRIISLAMETKKMKGRRKIQVQ